MTWKPRPPGGPPSAWIEMATSARLPIAARSAVHGPCVSFEVRVSVTVAPRASSAAFARAATSRLKTDSG